MTRRAAALVIALVLLAACGGDEDATLVGYEVSPVPQVGDHRLDDAATGRTDVPLRAEPGRLLVAFLGFTNCPDACPTALAEVRDALERLDDEASIVDVAMITVDPQRDTPEILTDFVQNFDSDAWALRTDDPDELQQVVTALVPPLRPSTTTKGPPPMSGTPTTPTSSTTPAPSCSPGPPR